MEDSFFLRLAKAAPRIKTPLSLAGFVAAVAGFLVVRATNPQAVVAQLAAGGIGVGIIIFAQLLGTIVTFPKAQRVLATVALFFGFLAFLLVFAFLILRDKQASAEGRGASYQPPVSTGAPSTPADPPTPSSAAPHPGREVEPPASLGQEWSNALRRRRAQARTQAPSKPLQAPRPTREPRIGASTAAQAEEPLGDFLVGITLWRLRSMAPQEDVDRALVFLESEKPLVAERVEAATIFRPGDRLRISVESGRSGFLYLVDRELYADGSVGEPHLIFPRDRIRGGNNAVRAGRLVEVPALTDSPTFFTMKQSRPSHVGDELIVLLTPEPLAEVPIGAGPVKLSPERVEFWLRTWDLPTKTHNMAHTAGAPYTLAERDASQQRARLLTYDEPLPQTLFFVDAQPGKPLIIRVPLRLLADRMP